MYLLNDFLIISFRQVHCMTVNDACQEFLQNILNDFLFFITFLFVSYGNTHFLNITTNVKQA